MNFFSNILTKFTKPNKELSEAYYLLGTICDSAFSTQCDFVAELQTDEFIVKDIFLENLNKLELSLQEFLENKYNTNKNDDQIIEKQLLWTKFMKNKLLEFNKDSDKVEMMELIKRSNELQDFSFYCFDQWKFLTSGKHFKLQHEEPEKITIKPERLRQIDIKNLGADNNFEKIVDQGVNRLKKIIHDDENKNIDASFVDHELVRVLSILHKKLLEILNGNNLELCESDRKVINDLCNNLNNFANEINKTTTEMKLADAIECLKSIYRDLIKF